MVFTPAEPASKDWMMSAALRPLREPGLHLCILVSAVVDDDQVQLN